MPIKVTVCVGSSCHIRGSRAMIRKFASLLNEESLDDEVALVGCFCMERCGESMNWKFGDDDLSSTTVEEAVNTLRRYLDQRTRSGPSGCGSEGPRRPPE